ncbi:uncharacterized protein LOC123534972 [Mercenaria mercenaria]|uniref:uncharacterized protein LOC123534972 n=1 Tax=Mercenaria mercenaria TaxID=6596 RepID=UPI00234F4E43|nr:uncharacterized protein LOC123534972 [Mercenaria mercenaria]
MWDSNIKPNLAKSSSFGKHPLNFAKNLSAVNSGNFYERNEGRGALQSLLREIEKNQPLKRGEEGDDSEKRCDAELEITVDCLDIVDNDEFFECAIEEAKSVEQEFADIFKAQTGEELFREEEMDVVWEIRKSRLVSFEIKEFTEVALDEIGKYRFLGLLFNFYLLSMNDLDT